MQKVEIKDKILLSVSEAAALFGLGVNKIYSMIDDENCDFVLYVGTHRKIKRELFTSYLNKAYSI